MKVSQMVSAASLFVLFAAPTLPAFANESEVSLADDAPAFTYLGDEDVTAEDLEFATELEEGYGVEDHDRGRGGWGRGDDRGRGGWGRGDDRGRGGWGRSSGCDPRTQPYPHWGMKGGQCLKSCGALGGTHSFSNSCASRGMRDMGNAYDVPYCCSRGGRW